MLIVSHPTGNENVRQAALAFAEAGLLAQFCTCINWNPDSTKARVMPTAIANELSRRTVPSLVRLRLKLSPLREIGRLCADRLRLSNAISFLDEQTNIESVYRALDKKVAAMLRRMPRPTGVYCYEDGALETFRAAFLKGTKRFYELPIGYWREWRRIMVEETKIQPEWASSLQGIRDDEEKLSRKEEELQLADVVLVASSYTQTTLNAAPSFSGKVHVIKYGCPTLPRRHRLKSEEKHLKVLFVGAVTQRKGLSYLFEAIDRLKGDAILTVIGAKPSFIGKALEKALRKCRWLSSVSHDAVLDEMQRNDVLVLPSLFEGFGLVILEAMSQGLPVIATSHTVGPDVINEGQNGFIVPIRSAERIAEKLALLSENRGMLFDMRQAALKSALCNSWRSYRIHLAEAICCGFGF